MKVAGRNLRARSGSHTRVEQWEPHSAPARNKETVTGQSRLFYDGTTYESSDEVAHDLLKRGVIVADPPSDLYALSLQHEIAEVEPYATVLERSDAPRPPRPGRLRVRGFSLLGGVEQRGFPSTINRLAPDEDELREP